MTRLTAEQRYRQAMLKARIISRRELRDFMNGRVQWMESTMDLERSAIIDELERAYQAGARSAHDTP